MISWPTHCSIKRVISKVKEITPQSVLPQKPCSSAVSWNMLSFPQSLRWSREAAFLCWRHDVDNTTERALFVINIQELKFFLKKKSVEHLSGLPFVFLSGISLNQLKYNVSETTRIGTVCSHNQHEKVLWSPQQHTTLTLYAFFKCETTIDNACVQVQVYWLWNVFTSLCLHAYVWQPLAGRSCGPSPLCPLC